MKFTYAADARPVDGFTIRRGIHRGGFGEVYYAVSDAGKEVALKLLTHDLDTELRGIRQCLNLKHPNLITIFDVRTDGDGDCWVVMEYVNGSNLEEVLTAFPQGLPISEVRDWMQGIVAGVEYLHDRGLIHRDLKPANIYRENGTVKIGDVGLSKRFDGERRNQHTESIGTVYYMAPEITHGKYGPAVDVYSLGIILYELLTGRLPFNGESSGEILMKQLSAAPDLSIVPPNLRGVISHALEKDPQKRTPSARQLWIEFEQAQSPTDIPDSHFVNGSRPAASVQAAQRDTDRSRDTASRTAGHHAYQSATAARPAPTSTQSKPKPGRHARRHFGEFQLGLAALALVLLFIPWHSMSWNDCGEAAGMVGFVGGFLLLLLWAREHWRPDHEPPWQLPFTAASHPSIRTDWAGTLAIAALAAVAFANAPLLVMFTMYPPNKPLSEMLVFISAAAVLGSWTVIACSWFMSRSAWAARHPRLLHAVAGTVLATAVYGLQDYLMIRVGSDRLITSVAFRSLGVNPLILNDHLTWFGYAIFFSGLFFLLGKRFGKMQDPQRRVRWSLWHPLVAVIAAWLWMHVFAFSPLLGLIWAAAITASVQLAAPWQAARTLETRN